LTVGSQVHRYFMRTCPCSPALQRSGPRFPEMFGIHLLCWRSKEGCGMSFCAPLGVWSCPTMARTLCSSKSEPERSSLLPQAEEARSMCTRARFLSLQNFACAGTVTRCVNQAFRLSRLTIFRAPKTIDAARIFVASKPDVCPKNGLGIYIPTLP